MVIVISVCVAVVSYLIGSFPTAYVIGKYVKGIDILKSGTGNVGAMNAYEVTGSGTIGITVGAIDILKGMLVTLLAGFGFGYQMIAAFFAVLGHNYSVFLKFRGGRGLATAAGALLIIQPVSVVLYLLVYFALRAAKLKLYISSVCGILVAGMPLIIKSVTTPIDETFAILMLLAVLSRHLFPLIEELRHAS